MIVGKNLKSNLTPRKELCLSGSFPIRSFLVLFQTTDKTFGARHFCTLPRLNKREKGNIHKERGLGTTPGTTPDRNTGLSVTTATTDRLSFVGDDLLLYS